MEGIFKPRDGWDSHPYQLLGRQLYSPLYHHWNEKYRNSIQQFMSGFQQGEEGGREKRKVEEKREEVSAKEREKTSIV